MVKSYEELLNLYPRHLAVLIDMLNKEIGFGVEVYATLKTLSTGRYNLKFDIEMTTRSRKVYTYYDYVILDESCDHTYRVAVVKDFMKYFDDLFKHYNLKPSARMLKELDGVPTKCY